MIERPAIMDRIRPLVGPGAVKVLAGPRRSGKSTMLKLVVRHLLDQGAPRRSMMHIDFASQDAPRIRDGEGLVAHVREAMDVSQDRPVRLFLDEVQELDGWEAAVRALADGNGADIYLTGSNAGILSDALMEGMPGRIAVIGVRPFSFSEFLDACRDTVETSTVDRHALFRDYLVQGGFPFQTELGFDRRATVQYVGDLAAAALFHDVMRPNAIRDADALERTLRLIARTEGKAVTVADLVAMLRADGPAMRGRRVSPETVTGHLDALARAFLIERVPLEDPSTGRAFKIGERIHLADPAIRQALGYDNLAAEAMPRVTRGVVLGELRRRGWTVTSGKPSARSGRGIDFIARKAGAVSYLQVVAAADSPADADAAFGALAAMPDNWPKTVLGLGGAPRGRAGIHGMEVADWLLDGGA